MKYSVNTDRERGIAVVTDETTGLGIKLIKGLRPYVDYIPVVICDKEDEIREIEKTPEGRAILTERAKKLVRTAFYLYPEQLAHYIQDNP